MPPAAALPSGDPKTQLYERGAVVVGTNSGGVVTDLLQAKGTVAGARAAIEVERQYDRPRGILWDHLQPPQIREIPILERMGYA